MIWLKIFLSLVVATAGVHYVWRRHVSGERTQARGQHLADELAFLKREIGLDGDDLIGTIDELHALLDEIEFSHFISDDDRDDLIFLTESEYYEPSNPTSVRQGQAAPGPADWDIKVERPTANR